MSRLRAVGVSAAVTLAVFVYLALPLLREMIGPVVNLPVYAGIALLAGGVTWSVVRNFSTDPEPETPAGMRARRDLETGETDAGPDGDEEPPREPDVEAEMEQLREER